ncbi:hypothetical protein X771_32120 [Mesorhizobium sp. LSJC277A00]|nr:hypothetical protein X771_32120 [Mesorhizobium sp. LSJC277A00]
MDEGWTAQKRTMANDAFGSKRGSHAYMTAGATRLLIAIWGEMKTQVAVM